MPRLNWDAAGAHIYETGIDRGVLYVDESGVPWNGLTSVDERPSGGDTTSYYIDGVRYLTIPASEDFEATISAFTYPEEFGPCDGSSQIRAGFFAMQQRRKPFGLSYRTLVGNEIDGTSLGYKLHLVYNVFAAPSQRTNASLKDSSDLTDFSWDITTTPEAITGFKSTAHLVLDSRFFPATALSTIEDILYGTDTTAPRLPLSDEIADAYDVAVAGTTPFVVIDLTGGVFSVAGSDDAVLLLSPGVYQITHPTDVVTVDETHSTISSS